MRARMPADRCAKTNLSHAGSGGDPRVRAGTDGRGPKCHDRLVSRLIRKGTPEAGAGKDARGPKCHNTISLQR